MSAVFGLIFKLLYTLVTLAAASLGSIWTIRVLARRQGSRIKSATRTRRKFLLKSNPKMDTQSLIFGFFHPYCHAGGGGERVLWAAIRATLHDIPNSFCIVYSGDTGFSKTDIISRANNAFGIELDESRIDIVMLKKRHLVSAEAWPRFTLIGQSLGSVILGYEAISSFPSDVFIDTMGYAFTYPLVHYCLNIPVISYTHYPTITSDMFSRVSLFNIGKIFYWRIFAVLYSLVGRYADYVMANSTWTMNHLRSIWKMDTTQSRIVYPPCDTSAFSKTIKIERQKNIVCLAQFRPEKDHATLLRAFAVLVHDLAPELATSARMTFIGTVRDEGDRQRVQQLKALARELKIDESITFCTDMPWPEVQKVLEESWIGANAMWNEHFGIGVVEYMAAGLIPVVHDSAGPKLDIVTHYDGSPTGFHATDVSSFAAAFKKAFSLDEKECAAMRRRAQESSSRFSEQVFTQAWGEVMSYTLKLVKRKRVE